MSSYGAGGFIPFSPPPSSIASSDSPQGLPRPRSSPLRAGGSKESSFIRHVDQQILHIQRRFAKRRDTTDGHVKEVDEEGRMIEEIGDNTSKSRLASSEEWHDVSGYGSFAEAARDVENLMAVIWVSGTPSLQIPYLISLALLTNTMIPSFPASPRHLFRLIGKLDHAFASLLQGRDTETGDLLPGFDRGRKVNTTEKVRIKSLIERTRVAVTNVMANGDIEEDDGTDTAATEDEEGDLILDEIEDDVPQMTDWSMQVAKVYDITLVTLGESLQGPAIGIRTEPYG